MSNLDSILKSRNITLPTGVCLVKAMVFPVVMYGCESWTAKKAERRRIDAFEQWCWRRLLRVPCLRLLTFLPAILIPACASSSPAFLMMYSACKLNKQGAVYSLEVSFSYLEPVCCSMSCSNCCFLTCIHISQEAGEVVWYS